MQNPWPTSQQDRQAIRALPRSERCQLRRQESESSANRPPAGPPRSTTNALPMPMRPVSNDVGDNAAVMPGTKFRGLASDHEPRLKGRGGR